MEQINEMEQMQEHTGYKPRPKWQIVVAWIGLALMVTCVALYYYHIANGGI